MEVAGDADVLGAAHGEQFQVRDNDAADDDVVAGGGVSYPARDEHCQDGMDFERDDGFGGCLGGISQGWMYRPCAPVP